MADLELHSEKGVNPRMTVCRNCGKDVGLVLLGWREFITTCPCCDMKLIGGSKCPKCKVSGVDREMISDHAKLPIELCDACREKEEAADAVVREGGVYWRCVDCRSTGAVRANAPMAQDVRQAHGIKPPAPCGVEFSSKDYCPVCGPNKVADEKCTNDG